MAWVRPKHPPPKKPKPDPVVTFLPMLSYISSSRLPPSRSPTKQRHQDTPDVPLSHDPIIRSFQQTQARNEDKPTGYESAFEEPPPDHLSRCQRPGPSRSQDVRECHKAVSKRADTVRQHRRESSPPPPPPPPLARPQPRVVSYERLHPRNVERDRHE
ncbi:MAG: hypothetical protein Q9209_007437 [Squamulea sp. 1 TL-2023]